MRAGAIAGVLLLSLSACNGAEPDEPAKTAPSRTAEAGAAPPNGSGPAVGTKVKFSGCPAHGVEAGCIVVASNGATYNITGATPKVELRGQGVSGEGVVTDGMSFCMQGVILRDISYVYTKQRCPLSQPPQPEGSTP